jgi:hypothetical protein
VTGLKEEGSVVAVTGFGSIDALVFYIADVLFWNGYRRK